MEKEAQLYRTVSLLPSHKKGEKGREDGRMENGSHDGRRRNSTTMIHRPSSSVKKIKYKNQKLPSFLYSRAGSQDEDMTVAIGAI